MFSFSSISNFLLLFFRFRIDTHLIKHIYSDLRHVPLKPTITYLLLGYKFVLAMAQATTFQPPSKANIGVYTNTKHDLWVSEAKPSLEDVKTGQTLKDGQVTVEIRSTGICG